MEKPKIKKGPFILKRLVAPPIEVCTNLFLYLYLFYSVISKADEVTQQHKYRQLGTISTDWFGLQTDKSLRLWESHKRVVRSAWFNLLLYLLASKVLRQRLKPLQWSYSCGILSFLFAFQIFGWRCMLVLSANIALFTATAILFRARAPLWVLFFALKLVTICNFYRRLVFEIVPKNEYQDRFYVAYIFVSIRCLMFFDDAIRLKVKKPLLGKQNLCTFLHFLFYPPTLLFGPIVTYRTFICSVLHPVGTSAVTLGYRAARLLFAAMLLHASLYVFYPSFLAHPNMARETDWSALTGCLYLKGLAFYLVYVQKYGLSWILGRCDGIKMPEWPVCCCHVFSYVEMWRMFDRGLYAFMKDYIYVPLGGSRFGLRRKVVSSLACFGFCLIYHGAHIQGVVIWVLMNLVQILVEHGAVQLYFSDRARPLTSALTAVTTRRLFALLASWMFLFSQFAFYSFDLGWPVFKQHLLKAFNPQFVGFYALWTYTMVQLAIEVRVRGWYDPRAKQSDEKVKRSVTWSPEPNF